MPHFFKKLAVAITLTCALFTSAFAAELPASPQKITDFEKVWDYAIENNSDSLSFHYDEKQSINVYHKYELMIDVVARKYRYVYPEKFNYMSLKDCTFVEDEDSKTGFTMVLEFGDLNENAKREYYTIALEEAEKLYHTVTDKLSPELSQKARAKILCHAITERVMYKNDNTDLCHTAYCALTNGYAVCDGYTSLLNMLLRMDGIECRGCWGKTSEDAKTSHEWTCAKLDGEWVYIDVTWVDGGKYEYLAMTEDEISKTHIEYLDYFELRDRFG